MAEPNEWQVSGGEGSNPNGDNRVGSGLAASEKRHELRGMGATLAIAPCQHMSAAFQTFLHTPRTSRIIPSSFLPGTLRSRSKAREDRRFRLVTDEVTGPERPRPRVPLPPLRAVRAGRAHSRRGQCPKAQKPKAKCIEGGAERTRTEIAGGARKLRHIV